MFLDYLQYIVQIVTADHNDGALTIFWPKFNLVSLTLLQYRPLYRK